MVKQDTPEDTQSPGESGDVQSSGESEGAQALLESLQLGEEVVRERLLDARENLLQQGLISESFGNRLEQFAREADLGIRIRVPKRLLHARLVRLDQMEDFTWTNSLFEILFALATCFLGALIGYLPTKSSSGLDSITLLLTIFTAILAGLTIYLLIRRQKIMKGMIDEQNFVSLIESGLGLDLSTSPRI